MNEEKLSNNDVSKKKAYFDLSDYSDAMSLFTPIIFFGALVYVMDKFLDRHPIIMIAGVFITFIFTNISIYRKMKVIIAKYSEEDKRDKTISNTKK